MEQRYRDWIDGHVTTVQAAYGTCRSVSAQMKQAFPELRVVRGFYLDVSGKHHPHHWCEDLEGEVVDPTRIQFELEGHYQETT